MPTVPPRPRALAVAASRPQPVRAVLVAAFAVVAMLVLVLTARPASAHVESSEQPAAAGGRTPVTFRFDHGCNGQPTTYLRVQIPEGVTDVVPEDPPGWTSQVTGDELRWDGGPVPDGEAASFTAVVTIDRPEGTVLYFPTIQGCPTAESAWIQLPDDANPEPDYPAPRIVVGTASDAPIAAEPGDGHAGAAPSTTVDAGSTTTLSRVPLEATPVTETGSERNTAGVVVLVVVVAIIVGGALVLYFRHRKPRTGA